jgi:hypothetical protein
VPDREAAREIVRCCRSGPLKSEPRSADLVEVDLAGTHREGSRQATTELDLQLPEIALLMGEVPCSLRHRGEPGLRGCGRAVSGNMTRLTREQIDALERMRGMPSHGQNDLGY